MKEYYRVDKRLFAVGDVVRTAGQYQQMFEGIARDIEDALEVARPPGKAKRADCLFVFESLAVAKKHWSKLRDGKLYRAEANEATICHRADMALMDAMKAEAEAGRGWAHLMEHYWAGEMSAAPEIEVMLPDATIVEVISISDSERKAHLLARWRGQAV